MRRRPLKEANSEFSNSSIVTKSSVNSGVELTSSELAQVLHEIKERLSRLETEAFGTNGLIPHSPPKKPKRGRKPKLDQQELLERRDQLVTFLEQNWPYLSVALCKAQKPRNASG